MSIRIYHNPRCGKSRTALEFLKQLGQDVEVIEYLKTPPTEMELKVLLQQMGLKAEALIRKKEALYKEKFAGKKLTEEQWIRVLVENPLLIERPIIVKDGRAVIGRSAASLAALR